MALSVSSPPAPSLALGSIASQLEEVLEVLHEVWLLLRGDRNAERGETLTVALAAVMDPLLRIYQLEGDPLALVEMAQRQTTALAEGLSFAGDVPWQTHAGELVAQARGRLSEAETRLRRLPSEVSPPITLSAGLVSPALQRGPWNPRLPSGSNLVAHSHPHSSSATHATEEAQPGPTDERLTPEGYSADPLPRLTHEQWCQFHAVDCFGDIVALLPQRVPQLGESWRLAEFIEQRLLANLDGLAALGDEAYAAVEQACRQAIVVDAALAGGMALVAGCVAGRDLLAVCERFLLTWETDKTMWQAVADAWKLAPNPWLGALCDRYVRSPDPRKVCLALEVLAFKGILAERDVARLLEGAALPPQHLLPHFSVLPQHMSHDWLRRLHATNGDVVEETSLWWASALNHYPPAVAILESAAPADETGEAWLILSLYGERKHAETLLQTFAQMPTPALGRALGWAGLGSGIPILISSLISEDPELKSAVAMALERITGAGLFEEVEVAPERVQDPDVPDGSTGPGEAGAFTKNVSDPRDAAPEGSPDTLLLPAVNHATWSAYWQVNSNRFSPEARYRGGLPVTPSVLLDELKSALRTPADRRLIHRELTLRTGRQVRFDPHQWVAEQQLALEQWAQAIEGIVVQPGTWFRHRSPA